MYVSLVGKGLTLYEPMTHICVMSSHKNLYEGLILGVNTLYRLFCFSKLFPMVGKGLNRLSYYIRLCLVT